MSKANRHGPKRAILYARVSTEEQAESGYSLPQQIETLREYAAREGYEVLEEVTDPGQSGATLARPGMDRVRDLVSVGGVSVVLAQDRDRFARKPAYNYLLQEEFAEHGCELKALNDYGDGSPEGMLMRGIQDQFAEYERAKVAERTRRGLLRKAREGKVIKGPKPNFGFRFNDTNDQLIMYEPEMRIVEKVFTMAAKGMGPKAIQTRLYQGGIPSPTGKKMWPHRVIKTQLVLNDLYRPHSYEEIATLVSPEVAARLDPSKSYGIWWYNRRNVKKKQASEPDGSDGRRYTAHTLTRTRDKEEWIAVPVPACLPRELVDQARLLFSSRKGYERKHQTREWEVKGLMRCSCGQRMMTWASHGGKYSYYRCKRAHHYGPDACPQKGIRFEEVEPLVWDFVSQVLKDPEKIRCGLEALIQRQHEGTHGDKAKNAEEWEDKLVEYARLRRAYQDQQATGLMTLDELRSRLEELDEARNVAEVELAALRRSQERAEELEKDREAVLASLAARVPKALDALSGEERNRLYRTLRLEITPTSDGFDVTGVFCTLGPTPADRKGSRERRGK